MTKNVGMTDKLVRVLIALALGLLYYFKVVDGNLATALLVIAVVLLLTSLFNFCPLYRIFGMNTCKVK